MPSPPEPQPPRPSPSRFDGYLANEEARRQLTTVHLALRRGQIGEAERAVQDVIARLPNDASAQEMLGDVRLARGDNAGALEAFRAALEREPGRVSAENKVARMTLRLSEDSRRQSLGVAYASEGRALVSAGGQDDPNRRKRLILFSAILPGLGQIFAGDFLKGGILLAIYAVGTLILGLTGFHLSFSVTSVAAFLILTVDWIYAVVDAAREENST